MTKLKKCMQNKKIVILCLIVIILVQCVIGLFNGSRKSGFMLDEVFTYELANDSGGTISHKEGFIDAWHDSSYYHDVLSINSDERFNFSIPYVNQENDVHPFLYYFAVHFVCSLFPEAQWKWAGILINLCFCVLTSVFLFRLAKTITKSNVFALISVIAWSWSIGAAGTMIFLRMYAMLGMWCVILALLQAKLMQNVFDGQPIHRKSWIGLWLITAAGILTHYYFLIYCVILCLLVLIFLLFKRKWKQSLLFVIAEFGGAALAIICFPAMIRHIFNGGRGTEAFANFASSGNFLSNLRAIVITISDELFNGWLKEILVIGVAGVILCLLLLILRKRRFTDTESVGNGESVSSPRKTFMALSPRANGIIIILGIVSICYIILVSRIAPYLVDRYYFCIYPIISMVAVYVLFIIVGYIVQRKVATDIICLLIVLLITMASYMMQSVPYVFDDYAGREADLADYLNYPVIVVNLDSNNGAADKWLYEYEQFPEVYRCQYGSFEKVADAAASRNLSKGFLVYAQSSHLSNEEFIEELSNYIDISNWEIVTSIKTRVYFCEPAD